MTLYNPNRISEAVVKAYWAHWYDLAQEGQPFCFTRIKDYVKPKGHGNSDEEDMGEDKPSGAEGQSGDEQDKPSGEEDRSGDERQEGAARTPKHCKSEEEKIAFLRALLPQSETKYHSTVTAVSLLEVGIYFILDHHLQAL